MRSKSEILKVNQLENEILELIDNQDDYTRSDLQGVAMAIITRAIDYGKEAIND